MTFEEIAGTRMTLDVAWDGETGVRVRVLDNDPVVARVPIRARTIHELMSRPLTVEQAAVAITSHAEVYDPTGDAVTVLSVDADTVTVQDDDETREWYLTHMRPSSSLLRVIAQRYGRGVTLGDDC